MQRLTIVLAHVLLLQEIGVVSSAWIPTDYTQHSVQSLASHLNEFAVHLIHELAQDRDRANVVVSPFSLSSAVAVLLLGAEGVTQHSLKESLYCHDSFSVDRETLLRAYLEVFNNERRNESGPPPSTDILIVDDFPSNAHVTKFQNDVARLLGASLVHADVGSQSHELRNWLSRYAEGLGEQIVDSGSQILLFNSMSFSGRWRQPFNQHQAAVFYNNGADGQEKEFMMQTGCFGYAEMRIAGQSFRAVELPFVADSIAMLVFLPEERNGLQKVWSAELVDRDLEAIESVNDSMPMRRVNLFLPEFQIRGTYDMKDAFAAPVPTLNMSNLFSDEAYFSGVNGRRNLHVGRLLHRSSVSVNEEGANVPLTGRGEQTDPRAADCMTADSLTVDFRAEHPFFFLIRDTTTGLVLFIGKVDEEL